MEQWIAMLLLASAIWLLQIRKISDSVPILAFQSFVLALTAGAMWHQTGLLHLFVAALLTLIVKSMIIPAILHYTIRKIDVHRQVERVTSKYASLLIAIILAVAGFYVTSRLHLPSTKFGAPYLPASVTLVFLGTFIMIDHKKALMQGVGLITIENGLFLAAQSMSYGMPLMVELGIFFDMLVTVVIIGILSLRIHSAFESLNIEKMSSLKG
ncbi:hydrogenase [Geobacillus subterraneus]|uniref:hydrogenase n=1 Tax=Geobacillus subterraneus TaxID=129338 RepID=UPI001622BD66